MADKKPFFIWFNTTRMHVWTHLKKSAQGRTGMGLYPDGMVKHDDMVGALLKKLDDLGIASNTIVVYSTDNGAETVTWPDGGTTPFRGEKGTTWEGGFRVPLVVRWPGVIKPGTVYNDIISQEDWLPHFAGGGGSARHQGEAQAGPSGWRKDVARSLSTGTTSCPISGARRKRGRARRSTTSARAAS